MIYSCAPPPPRGCGVESHATTALLPKYGAGHTGNGAPKAGQCPTKAAYQMERKTPARSGVFVCMATLCKTSITGRIFRSTVSKLSTRDVTDTDTRTHQNPFSKAASERESESGSKLKFIGHLRSRQPATRYLFLLPDPLTGDVFVQLFSPPQVEYNRNVTSQASGEA